MSLTQVRHNSIDISALAYLQIQRKTNESMLLNIFTTKSAGSICCTAKKQRLFKQRLTNCTSFLTYSCMTTTR